LSVLIIAEAGVNHNGDKAIARDLIDAASEAGADTVKFQTFRAEALVSDTAPKAGYQAAQTGSAENQFEMLKRLELDQETFVELSEHSRKSGLQFLSTAFDEDSLKFLIEDIRMDVIKVPSGELTNAPLLLRIGERRRKTILSTGMGTLDEIERALGVLAYGWCGGPGAAGRTAFEGAFASDAGQTVLRENVTLLQCTSEYPAPADQINLRAMQTLREKFGLTTGLSDHSTGIAVPIAAAALGAVVIEKHFTLDRSLPGPDHAASLEPDELKSMVRGIRDVTLALGTGVKAPTEVELENAAVVRRRVVARTDIKAGEPFGLDNLTSRRPGDGLSPMEIFDRIGQPSPKDYAAGDPIEL
jgi:N-acetylneuraminate synthase